MAAAATAAGAALHLSSTAAQLDTLMVVDAVVGTAVDAVDGRAAALPA